MSTAKEEISNFTLNPLRRVAHEDPHADPRVKGQRERIRE